MMYNKLSILKRPLRPESQSNKETAELQYQKEQARREHEMLRWHAWGRGSGIGERCSTWHWDVCALQHAYFMYFTVIDNMIKLVGGASKARNLSCCSPARVFGRMLSIRLCQ